MRRGVARVAVLMAATALLISADVSAQGRGQARGRRARASAASESSTPPASALNVPGTGIRHFGAWLDDAFVAPPGRGWAGFSFGYWRSPLGQQIDFPVVDASVGIAPRVQVGVSLPYSYLRSSGATARALGDTYLSAKVQLRDPLAGQSSTRVGFSVTPLLEILGSNSAFEAERRVQWALPASIELQGSRARAYASAGYFSRGALFESGAVEIYATDRTGIIASLTHSYSTKADPLSDLLGFGRHRVDLSGGGYYLLRPDISVFATVGRTISKRDDTSTTFGVSAGISVGFAAGGIKPQ